MRRLAALALFFLSSSPLFLFAEENLLPVEINGDQINYLQENGQMLAKGNVKITYKDVKLFCDEATYDAKGHVAHIKGNVKIVRSDTTIFGENIDYDFSTQNAVMKDVNIESAPLYGHAKEIAKEGQDQYVMNNGYFTTCNLKKPHYYLSAKKIIIYPQKEIIARDVFFKIGNVPILYVPYFSQSLQQGSFPLQVIPGKKRDWGIYALTRYGYTVNPEQKGKLIADWYDERGFGYGVTHKMESKKFGTAVVNYYAIDDKLYELDKRSELFDKYPERNDREQLNPQALKESQRYKGQFFYSAQPTPNLSVRAELNKFSDELFMKDFFYKEYEVDQRPLSYLLLDYGFENSALSLLTQKQVNSFFTQTEYLPSLQYDFYRQKLGESDLYFQSQSSFANLSHKFAYFGGSEDYDALRLHSHNILSYPKSFDWLYLNPYIGTYSTYYNRNAPNSNGLNSTLQHNDVVRFAPEAGMDLGTKMYNTYDTDFKVLGAQVNKVRHIITPTVGYHYIGHPSISRGDLLRFDEIDSLQQDERIVATVGNKLQARNDQRTWDFLYVAPSIEYRIFDPTKEDSPWYLDLIRGDLEFYPIEGLSFTARSVYDRPNHALREFSTDFGVYDTVNKKYGFALGNRYAKDESAQGTVDWMYQLTPKLQFKNYLRYEYKSGHLQEQQYALRTDLHCWWMDAGVDVNAEKDLTFWIKFVLKDFPDVHVGFDQTYNGPKSSY